jgi:hypothetical protein
VRINKFLRKGSLMEIRVRNRSYVISDKVHRQNLLKLKKNLPEVLEEIPKLEKSLGKPPFRIQKENSLIYVVREDFEETLQDLMKRSEAQYEKRLSVSEWEALPYPSGYQSFPVTLHDVYSCRGVTIKLGNPYRNNSWEEFFLALQARALGMVEAKSPLGFSFHLDDPYGTRYPGKMFYKHLEGIDLEQAIKLERREVLNWALWEAGKFFSRLFHAHLFLRDAHRLGNFFIEKSLSTQVFRFLDLEEVRYFRKLSENHILEMLSSFVQKAFEINFLDQERLGEFVAVALGSYYSNLRNRVLEKIAEGNNSS